MPQEEWSHVYLGVVTLSLVVLLCMTGVSCLLAVLYFHWRVVSGRRLRAWRDLDAPWCVRALLTVFSVFWGVGELLRLPLFRRLGWPFHGLRPASQAYLCGVNVAASAGLWVPGFFLATLALVRWSLRAPPYENDTPNIFRVVAATLPFLALQVTLIIVSSVIGEGFGAKIPPYFTAYFIDYPYSPDSDVGGTTFNPDDKRLTLCTYPLLSALSLAAFAIFFSIFFLVIGLQIITLSINRKLRRRVSHLVLVFVTCLPLHSMFLGFSSLLAPSDPAHETLTFLAFLTLLVCMMVGQGMLVLHPIMAGLAVGLNLHRRLPQIWPPSSSFNAASSLHISARSLSSINGQEEDESSRELERKSLLDADDLFSV